MSQVIGEHYPELEIKKIIQEQGDHPTDQPEPIREARKRSVPAPPYSSLLMPGSRASLMAVVDENGYLIPFLTAHDLLRRCKAFWRASQD